MQSREPAREQESLKRTRGMEQESLRWKGNHCGELQWGKKNLPGCYLYRVEKKKGFWNQQWGRELRWKVKTLVEGERQDCGR